MFSIIVCGKVTSSSSVRFGPVNADFEGAIDRKLAMSKLHTVDFDWMDAIEGLIVRTEAEETQRPWSRLSPNMTLNSGFATSRAVRLCDINWVKFALSGHKR